MSVPCGTVCFLADELWWMVGLSLTRDLSDGPRGRWHRADRAVAALCVRVQSGRMPLISEGKY